MLNSSADSAAPAMQHYVRSVALYIAYLLPLCLVIGRAAADIAVSLVAVCYLLHIVSTRDWRSWWQCPYVKALTIFWLWLVLASCIADAGSKPIIKSLLYSRFLLFFMALRYWLYVDRASVIRAAWWAMPVLAFVVIDGWWQYHMRLSLFNNEPMGMQQDRLTGPFSHPNIGNYVFKCLLPIGVICMAGTKHTAWRMAAGGLLLAGVALIPATGERSTTLMLMVTLVMLLGLLAMGRKQSRRYALLGGGLLAGLTAWLSTQDMVVARAALFTEQVASFSASTYGQLFSAAWIKFTASPIVGHGLGTFFAECGELQAAHMVNYCDIHPHNFYLQLLYSTGVIGGLIMAWIILGMLIASAKNYWQHRQHEGFIRAIELALLSGFFFPLLVTQSFYSNWPASLFWLSLAWILSLRRLGPSHTQHSAGPK